MSDIAIRVEGLSKRYRRGTPSGHDRLTEVVSNLGRAALGAPRRWLGRPRPERRSLTSLPKADHPDEFWALRDVSFEVRQGEAVGIIGRNGAGKSTLLKVLSRITEPTEGRFGVRGRVGSLLEVGTGFHPELTGRENVYLNGTFLGMSRREIARKFDAIVAFAEIDEFLDTPVKRYSSGMQVRLGFGVAAHLDPEILIVDEALAVGDAAFQKKCITKMREVATSGRTVLFVSHSLDVVGRLCPRAVWLQRGAVFAAGPVNGVMSRYLEWLAGVGAARTAVPECYPGAAARIIPHPAQLPLEGEFSAGPAQHFQPRGGRWAVAKGRYTAWPEGGREAVSTLLLEGPLPPRFELAVAMTPDRDDPAGACNGLIVFDFLDPTRFKFAGCYVGLGRWVIGERVGDEWMTLAAVSAPAAAGREYALSLVVDGTTVRFRVPGQCDLVCPFPAWHGGTVGFATRGAVAHFREVRLRPGCELAAGRASPHSLPGAKE